MIKAILFDIDGTLLDTREFILHAYETVLKKHSKKPFTKDELRLLVGGGTLRSTYAQLAPELDLEILIRDHKKEHETSLHLIAEYQHVHETLKELKENYKLAAVTGRTRDSTITNLSRHNMKDYFDYITTSDDVREGKPHPQGILDAMKHLGVKRGEVLMVGDADTDIEAGKNAGVKTVGVTYGFWSPERMEKLKPDFIIHSIEEILDVLNVLK